ncbi:hypothetical protein ACVIHH_005835 [Bradyrhizobium sp. USDA 4518]
MDADSGTVIHALTNQDTEPLTMTAHRFGVRLFGVRLGFALLTATFAAPCALAQQADAPQKPGKMIHAGDVLSGELGVMKVRDAKNRGKRVATYQITSEPRRLPPPNGLCNLETGPETFQLIPTNDARGRATQKPLRQGNLGEGRRSRLRQGRRRDERSHRHKVERGGEVGSCLGYGVIAWMRG